MAEAEEVKLYGTWPSPFSRRVELALKIKGIPYEYIEEDLSKKSPQLLNYNPVHAKIPVLLHNGNPVVESLLILEYIDETWPNPPLLPEDPHDRAMVRFWAKFVDEKILESAKKSIKAEGKEEMDEAIEEVHQQLKLLEEELKGKDFFGGDTIGYLDIVVFYMAYRFQLAQEVTQTELLTQENFPILCKWLTKLLEMGVVKECVPPRDKHLDYVRARLKALKSGSK